MTKKNLKGMTLLEVIVAMVVLVICSSMIVEGAVSVINNTRTARNVVSKVDEQSPDVENRPASITAYETGAALQLEYNSHTYNIPIDRFEAPTTQVPEDQRCGNLKYFQPAVTATT